MDFTCETQFYFYSSYGDSGARILDMGGICKSQSDMPHTPALPVNVTLREINRQLIRLIRLIIFVSNKSSAAFFLLHK